MIKKTVTVIVLRADRELWDSGPLLLRVRDLREDLKLLREVEFPANSSIIEVNLDLPFDAGQLYGLEVDADNHRAARQIINHRTFVREESGHKIEIDNAIFRLMLVSENPSSIALLFSQGIIPRYTLLPLFT